MTFGLCCSQPACRPHPASLPVRVPPVEGLLRASFGCYTLRFATVAVIGSGWLLSSNEILPMLGTLGQTPLVCGGPPGPRSPLGKSSPWTPAGEAPPPLRFWLLTSDFQIPQGFQGRSPWSGSPPPVWRAVQIGIKPLDNCGRRPAAVALLAPDF